MWNKLLNSLWSFSPLGRRRIDLEFKPALRVNVLIAQDTGVNQHQILIFLEGLPAEVPDQLIAFNWRHLATTTLHNKLLISAAPVIEAEISRQGYSLLTLTR
jgi:hypothetical protein